MSGQDHGAGRGRRPRPRRGPRLRCRPRRCRECRERRAQVAHHLAATRRCPGRRARTTCTCGEPVGAAALRWPARPRVPARRSLADLRAGALGHDDERVGRCRRGRTGPAARPRRWPPACAGTGRMSTARCGSAARPRREPARTRQVTTMKAAGRAATRSPMRRHNDARVGEARLADPGDQRPEDPAAEQHQDGRQHDKAKPAATTMPTALASPSPRVDGNADSSRVSRAEHDGGRADQHGLAGAPQRAAHRGIPVRLRAQLVAVAGDEQQRVVGAGAEDEDRQDAEGRLVPRRCRWPAAAWVASTAASWSATPTTSSGTSHRIGLR